MKKIILGLVVASVLFCAEMVMAQENYPVFSSSLGGGGSYYNGPRRTMYTPKGRVAQQGPVRQKKVCKKTVIKYQPGQSDLTPEEKERYLAPIVQRIQKEEVKTISIFGYAYEYSDAFNRANVLARFFVAYGVFPKLETRTGMQVIKSNADTVEIVECR